MQKTIPANITFHVLEENQLELCRDLCNKLMAFQKSKASIAIEAFDMMNFDTRMKPSYEKALDKLVVLVKDGETPIGYVFATVEMATDTGKGMPPWAKTINTNKPMLGFYPDWLTLPQKTGSISNLYFDSAYRGIGLGGKLIDMALDWLSGFEDITYVLCSVSNGNDDALAFYRAKGFSFSHDVLGGFIQELYIENRKTSTTNQGV